MLLNLSDQSFGQTVSRKTQYKDVDRGTIEVLQWAF